MKWIVFVVGLLTAVFGVWWSWDGYNIVLVERGWAKHIAGAVIFGAGLLTMALAALMHKVQQLAAIMAEMRQAPRAYAPPAYAPQDSRPPVEEREDEPAPVVPPAPTAASAAALPTGAAAAAVAASLPPEPPAKDADDDMLAAVGAALAAEPPREPAPAPALRPAAPFTPKLPEYREPFVFRPPPPPPPREAEATLDFSLPPPEPRTFTPNDPAERPLPPIPAAEPTPEPETARFEGDAQGDADDEARNGAKNDAKSEAADDATDDANPAPEVTITPPPSEAPKLDHLFAEAPPEPPKAPEEPPRRRSSFDWLTTARRRAETAAPSLAREPEPAPVADARDEPADAPQEAPPADHAAEDIETRDSVARENEPAAPGDAPDVAEELVEAPVTADEADTRLVRRYESQGVKYSLYEDGSIRAESERGTFRFGSLVELRAFLEKGG